METPKTTKRLKQLLPQLFERDRAVGERYLTLEITPEFSVAIPLSSVWEATRLPASAITPIPQMPPYVLGWNNGRDRVYCVISLAELLGLEKATKHLQEYSTLIVQVPSTEKTISGKKQSFLLGLTVNRILRTITVNPEAITSARNECPDALTPYLQGSLKQDEQQFGILDLRAITQQMQ